MAEDLKRTVENILITIFKNSSWAYSIRYIKNNTVYIENLYCDITKYKGDKVIYLPFKYKNIKFRVNSF